MSRGKLLDRVRDVRKRKTKGKASEEVIFEINSAMQGSSGTFRYGHGKTVLNRMHDLISERLRTWLWKKQSKSEAKVKRSTRHRLKKQSGLKPMNLITPTATGSANRRRIFGKPDAGKPPARFDEGGRCLTDGVP